MRSLRASRFPLHAKCAASVGDASSIRITGGGAPADMGTAGHKLIASKITGTMFDEYTEIHDAAFEYDVDPDELRRLVAWAWARWQDLAPWFPAPQTEVELAGTDEERGIHVTGHVDLLSVDLERRRLAICDWKSGWLDHDFTAQLRAYGLLGLLRYPEVDEVYLVACRIRSQEYSGEILTRKQLYAWWEQFADRLNEGGYNPGRWCGHCPVQIGCPAKAEHLAESAEWLLAPPENNDPVDWGAVYDRAKLIEDAVARAKEIVRAEVIANGGRLRVGDGRELVLTEQPRRSIDFSAGWPVIQEVLPDADLAGAVTISKSKVEEAARQFAARGRKGKAVQELMDRLDVAGAMRTTYIERLEVRRNGNDSDTGSVQAITSGAAAGEAAD